MSFLIRRVATRASLSSDTITAARPRLLSTTQISYSKSNSATSAEDNQQQPNVKELKETQEPLQKVKKKTMAELDEELKLKMEGMSGGGGSAGVEYENGKAEGLKRGVKDNMFRVI
ncbi:hypothetical protein N0V93_004857 [Gnomoniopsis smithogilvyi]|uniref:Uncharacterized protein n=1 Tax=Gnomoniopsis smithogilvyi TaxID=1191159 RepID=A0A9W8YUG4_9PEZI|nr:hypothetical protein N0V93_004857 [Gnomoniopsis smithogilvyi]